MKFRVVLMVLSKLLCIWTASLYYEGKTSEDLQPISYCYPKTYIQQLVTMCGVRNFCVPFWKKKTWVEMFQIIIYDMWGTFQYLANFSCLWQSDKSRESHYRYNVIFTRASSGIFLPWKGNKYHVFWVCVCSLSYPACKTDALYYIVICDLSGCTIFFHIIS
jgi:hypothetical protein